MDLTIVCPECGTRLRAPASAVGRNAKCPKCKAMVAVTGDDTESQDRWMVRIRGQTQGPFTFTQLQDLVAGKILQPDHEVRTPRTAWVQSQDVPGLFPNGPDGVVLDAASQSDSVAVEAPLAQGDERHIYAAVDPGKNEGLGESAAGMNTEKTYYSRDGVKITTTRAIFRERVYPINGMTSVRPFLVPPDRTAPSLFLIVGLVIFCCSLGGLLTVGRGPILGLMLAVAILSFGLAALCFWWLLNQKPRYSVRICTAAREQQAYVTNDKYAVDKIIEALNQAFMERG